MSLKILVVDDYQDAREFLQVLLESEGYDVITAADGNEAIEKTLSEHPSIVLMDICMPVLDGLEAAAAIRSDARTSQIPIVAVTAHFDVEPEARKNLFIDVISKPVELEDLQKTLQSIFPGVSTVSFQDSELSI